MSAPVTLKEKDKFKIRQYQYNLQLQIIPVPVYTYSLQPRFYLPAEKNDYKDETSEESESEESEEEVKEEVKEEKVIVDEKWSSNQVTWLLYGFKLYGRDFNKIYSLYMSNFPGSTKTINDLKNQILYLSQNDRIKEYNYRVEVLSKKIAKNKLKKKF